MGGGVGDEYGREEELGVVRKMKSFFLKKIKSLTGIHTCVQSLDKDFPCPMFVLCRERVFC